MGDSPTPLPPTDSDTEGGLASRHTPPQTFPVLVGPATSGEFNTVKAALIPVGCWRVEDLRFEFDSSIIRPETRKEFGKLSELVNQHPDAPVSLFGHADPVGDDTYNKALSGRRAEAIYAVLTRNVEMWETLYGTLIQGQGDAWKYKAIQVQLKALGHDPGPLTGTLTAATIEAVKEFQAANGLDVDGDPGPLTRGVLFPKYMDFLAPDLKLTPDDFLGKGAGPDRKADLQGCSEFNPVLMFSDAENKTFQNASNKEQRNRENAPNRRVLALLFRPGTKIDPGRWPCPTTKQGPDGCHNRFWSDAAERRKFQSKRRTFDSDKDTFACRFYHRLMVSSPCEGIKPFPIPVPLEGVKPLILGGGAAPVAETAEASSSTSEPRAKETDASVTPSIGPNNLVAIVKRPYTNPNRAIVLLKTDKAFDGKGKFERSKDIVKFFRKGSATPIQFGKDNVFSGADLTKGIELEAEGVKASAKTDDIVLTLTLSGGTKKVDPPAKATMTSVEVLLDICQPRTSTKSDPPVLATPAAAPAAGAASTDKFFGGRPLPLQFDTTNYDERAIVIVRQPKPNDFKGRLVLNSDDDKVKLFEAERPKKDEKPLALPLVIDPGIDKNGKRFFVEGAKESVTARDTGLLLGIQAMTAAADRVKITVCHTEVVSNREKKDLHLVAEVPEKPARKTKSPKFMPAPLIVGLEYKIELRPHIELAKMSAFAWSTPSAKITLTDTAKEIVKLKAKSLSAAENDVFLDVLLTTDLGKLKKRHKLTCVRVQINPVIAGDNIKHNDDINLIRNPAGCVILSGAAAGDAAQTPRYEITKIEPDLKWKEDDDRIAWWIVGGEPAGSEKYDGKADFRNAESSKRGTKIQVFGTQTGDVLIQPYSGGFGYGMFRAHVIPIVKMKYRLNRIFTKAQTAIPAQPPFAGAPAQAAQPAFPGGGGIAAQPPVPDLPPVAPRPAVAEIKARTAHAPTSSHAEAKLHMKIVNIYLRQAGIEMIPDDSAEVAGAGRAGRPALPKVDVQPAITAQVATPLLPGVPPQSEVPDRDAILAMPAIPEVKASPLNNKVGQASLDSKIIEVTQHSPGHFDVEVSDIDLVFNTTDPNAESAIRINARNEVVVFAYVESGPAGILANALLCPMNHAPHPRADPPTNTGATSIFPDKGTPSSSLIPKTGIPPSVPVDEVKMTVLGVLGVVWEGGSPATRDVNLLWGVVVPNRNIDTSPSGAKTKDKVRLAYGNTLAHELCHVWGMGHRGPATATVPDGLAIPADENLMHGDNPPPTAQNLDIIQVKALRFAEPMFRTP